MFEKLVDGKIETTPLGLKNYLIRFIPLFLIFTLLFGWMFHFPLTPVFLSILFYGIPFILSMYLMYALVFYLLKRDRLFVFSVIGLSVLLFEIYSLIFYHEPYFIHEIRAGNFPHLTFINLLSSFSACLWLVLKVNRDENK